LNGAPEEQVVASDLLAKRGEQMFPKLSPAQMARLETRGRRIDTHAGEILIEAGTRQTHVFVVVSGSIEVRTHDQANELLVFVLTAGDFSGEMSTLRRSAALATLRVREGVIVLETMIWPDEIRQPDFAFLGQDVTVRPQERKMAESLVASMVADFDPNEYTDGYRAALQQVIDAKVEGHEVAVPEQPASSDGGNVVDLMAALRASVDAAKRSRGESADSAPREPTEKQAGEQAAATRASAKKAPARRAAAAKEVVKTVAAKKAPAKKVGAKRASNRQRSA